MPEPKDRRRRNTKEKDSESSNGSVASAGDASKKERKRRAPAKRVKEEPSRQQTPSYGGPGEYTNRQIKGSPHPSSTGSGSASRSVQPSPTGSAPPPPSRVVDEDYDEGVAEALMGLAASGSNAPYRGGPDPRSFGLTSGPGVPRSGPGLSPTMLHHDRRPSMSSRASPPTTGQKRPLSPGPDDRDVEMKRSRVGSISSAGNGNGRRVSPQSGSGGRPSPVPSRLSPIPFRQQPTSHSPEARQAEARSYPPSPAPALPTCSRRTRARSA
ncbi:hypothetical protein EVJ58_g10721 [Rhodofomes roseus]|uniref:Uncharacterized protein n=1 Tax=Rhodofomes roseus TaxID=34475 RepID=A0A4Y9XM26_9APHY|nr:hypothetical protein EVJ58_g10721 [Rhodofomes roseus]